MRRGLRISQHLQDMVGRYHKGDLVRIWYVPVDEFYFTVIDANPKTGMLTLDPGNGSSPQQVSPDEVTPHPSTAQRIVMEEQKMRPQSGTKILDTGINQSPSTGKQEIPAGSEIIGPSGVSGISVASKKETIFKGMEGRFTADHSNDELRGKEFVVSKVEGSKALVKMGNEMTWVEDDDFKFESSPLTSRERSAIYHVQKGKVYRKTRSETESGILTCPICKSEMEQLKFDRGNPICRCPKCQFSVDSRRVVEGPPELISASQRRAMK